MADGDGDGDGGGSSSASNFVIGYLGPDLDNLNWEGGGEYLYALTVITTIGYGVSWLLAPHTAPHRCIQMHSFTC